MIGAAAHSCAIQSVDSTNSGPNILYPGASLIMASLSAELVAHSAELGVYSVELAVHSAGRVELVEPLPLMVPWLPVH